MSAIETEFKTFRRERLPTDPAESGKQAGGSRQNQVAQMTKAERKAGYEAAIEWNRLVYFFDVKAKLKTQKEIQSLIDKLHLRVQQMSEPFEPRVFAEAWSTANLEGIEASNEALKMPPGFVLEDSMEFLLDVYGWSLELSRSYNVVFGGDPSSVKLGTRNQVEVRSILALLVLKEETLKKRLAEFVKSQKTPTKTKDTGAAAASPTVLSQRPSKSISPTPRRSQQESQPAQRSQASAEVPASRSRSIQHLSNQQQTSSAHEAANFLNRFVYEVDTGKLKTQVEVAKVLDQLKGLLLKMPKPYEPRLSEAHFKEQQKRQDSSRGLILPEGFVYNHVLDFYLELYKLAHQAAYSRDDGSDESAKAKTEGIKNMQRTLNLVTPLLKLDPALNQRFKEFVQALDLAYPRGQVSVEQSEQESPLLNTTLFESPNPQKTQQRFKATLKSPLGALDPINFQQMSLSHKKTTQEIPTPEVNDSARPFSLANDSSYREDKRNLKRAESVLVANEVSPEQSFQEYRDVLPRSDSQQILESKAPKKENAAIDRDLVKLAVQQEIRQLQYEQPNSFVPGFEKMRRDLELQMGQTKQMRNNFETQLLSLSDFKTEFRRSLSDKQKTIDALKRRVSTLERAIQLSDDGKVLLPTHQQQALPPVINLNNTVERRDYAPYIDQMRQEFEQRLSEITRELSGQLKNSVVRQMNYEKVQEQQNSEIVELKLKSQQWERSPSQQPATSTRHKESHSQQAVLNLDGLQKTLEENDQRMAIIEELQHRTKLENLRMMLNFKSETQETGLTIDAIVTALENYEDSPEDTQKMLQVSRRLLSATNTRIQDEIVSIQRALEGLNQDGGQVSASSLDLNQETQQAIQMLQGEVASLRKESEILRKKILRKAKSARSAAARTESQMTVEDFLQFKTKIEHQFELQQLQTQNSIQAALKDVVKNEAVSKLQLDLFERLAPLKESLIELRSVKIEQVEKLRDELRGEIMEILAKTQRGAGEQVVSLDQLHQWVQELQIQMRHRIEENISLQGRVPQDSSTPTLSGLHKRNPSKNQITDQRERYEEPLQRIGANAQQTETVKVQAQTGIAEALTQIAELKTAIHSLMSQLEDVRDSRKDRAQSNEKIVVQDSRVDNLTQKHNKLAEMFVALNEVVRQQKKFHGEIVTDIGFLAEVPIKVSSNTLKNAVNTNLLGQKMNGLAQLARLLDLAPPNKVSDIINFYRATEIVKSPSQAEWYENATPTSQAILSVSDVLSHLVKDLNPENTAQKMKQVLVTLQLAELLTRNKLQALIALTKSRVISTLLGLIEAVNSEFEVPLRGQIAKTLLRVFAQLAEVQEGRQQLISLAAQKGSFSHMVALMKREWNGELDQKERLELVENGFKTFSQTSHDMMHFNQSFPGLLLDLTDLIAKYFDQPAISSAARSLLSNYQSIGSLPQHLQHLVEDFKQEDHELDSVMQSILEKTDPPRIVQKPQISVSHRPRSQLDVQIVDQSELVSPRSQSELQTTRRIADHTNTVDYREEKTKGSQFERKNESQSRYASHQQVRDHSQPALPQFSGNPSNYTIRKASNSEQKNNIVSFQQFVSKAANLQKDAKHFTQQSRERESQYQNQTPLPLHQNYIPVRQDRILNSQRLTSTSQANSFSLPNIRVETRTRGPNNIEILSGTGRGKKTQN